MRDFCITTDSNSDLPQEYINKLGTIIIPQYYSFGGTVYGDELNMAPAEFLIYALYFIVVHELSVNVLNEKM